MLQKAPTIEELAKALSQDLRAKGLSPYFTEELARALVKEFAFPEVPSSAPGRLGYLRWRYAIRKDDFKIFDAVADGLTTAAGVNFFMAQQPALAAYVAIGVSLAKLLQSLAMRGAFLESDKLDVLTILKCNVSSPSDSGLTPDEILKILRITRPDADLEWLQKRLDFLTAVPTRDGAATKLASADPSGRWRPHV